MKIRIGTRGSKLALWQADETKRLLELQGHHCDLVTIKTTGDKRTDVPLAHIGGKGLFIKELEEALLRSEIDLAVHSLKDVPSELDPQFALAAFLERADPRDAWISATQSRFSSLTSDCSIGTSSPRRRAQILQNVATATVVPIRGNVDTRLGKAKSGELDGVVLASAGLHRLGLAASITELLPVEVMVPAAGQGIVAIETLAGRDDVRDAVQSINHQPSALAARVERGVLQAFGRLLDCYSCIAVHATVSGQSIDVRAFVSDEDGGDAIRVRQQATIADADRLIREVHQELASRGARELLERSVTR